MTPTHPDLFRTLEERILVFDGAMGTALQGYDLSDADFWDKEGCNELLVLSRPDVVREVHAAYFVAGADVVETNSFGSNQIVLAEYDLSDRTYELNLAAAKLACDVAAGFSTAARPRWVSGSMGPGTKLPTLGHTTFRVLRESYAVQAQGLIDGGCHVLQIETCQDLLQAKAAISGAMLAFRRTGKRLPIIVQVTIEATGTMLLGSEIGAALTALEPFDVEAIGINCATGPAEMGEHVRYLGTHSPKHVSVLPNAGLPVLKDGAPFYPLTPPELAAAQRIFVEEHGVSMVGGCCGTTPAHIKALADALWGHAAVPRSPQFEPSCSSLYSSVSFAQETSFLVIGERLNANGSPMFRKRLLAEDYDGMQMIAKQQIREGAHALDLSVDYVGRDGPADMDQAAFRLATQSTLPLVIDSTEAPVIETALERIGGRAVINSINLEDGELRMDRVMPVAKEHGAALIALCIDEEGQARTAEWKLRVAHRIHDLVVNKWGMRSSDLIFDALTMPIATGQEEVRRDGLETLEAIRRIKSELPGVYTVLGVSNVSFGLKPAARQVLNSVFLHYAVEAGLDAAMVNPSKILPLHRIDPAQREAARQLVFDERSEDFDPLVTFMQLFDDETEQKSTKVRVAQTVEERLKNRIVDGERKGIDVDLDEAMRSYAPLAIINDILLDGMRTVGELFASGEMQLPFVLQSAEAMKTAVAYLEPHMPKADAGGRGTLVIGTVKGDVHDIGKNLVDIILSNNGYTVCNIGIKQPLQAFVEAAEQVRADAIGMSGLLVKSTVVMKENLLELNDRNLHKYPIMLGGAALTRRYVEHDLRGLYKGLVFYGQDAFEGLRTMDAIMRGEAAQLAAGARIAAAEQLEGYDRVETIDEDAEKKLTAAKACLIPSAIARDVRVPVPPFWGSRVAKGIALDDVYPFLNEVALFRAQWQYTNKRGLPKDEYEEFLEQTARPILREWQNRAREEQLIQPKVIYGYYPCQASGNSLIFYEPEGGPELARVTFPRQPEREHLCIADYFRPVESGQMDVVGLQLVTVGSRATERERELLAANQYTDYLHLHGFSVEMTEALAELWHKRMRCDLGIAGGDSDDPRGVFRKQYEGARFSFGYPACPEREDDAVIARLLQPERIGAELTEGWMWEPEQTTSALVVHHPDARYFNVL